MPLGSNLGSNSSDPFASLTGIKSDPQPIPKPVSKPPPSTNSGFPPSNSGGDLFGLSTGPPPSNPGGDIFGTSMPSTTPPMMGATPTTSFGNHNPNDPFAEITDPSASGLSSMS